jgi:sugar phosphate isomerase/epimerase
LAKQAAVERIGIEHLSVFGLPPVQFVNLVADLGCRYLATGLAAAPYNPHGYAPFSLKDDPALRREMIAAMRDRGVSISLGEGFSLREGQDFGDRRDDLEVMAELGVRRINTVTMDPDLGRSFDRFGKLAETAATLGMETTVEFGPGMSVGDLPTAVTAVDHVGRPDFRLLIDTMHFGRTGSGPADIAALDPGLIGYVQLSDAPVEPRFPTYMEEAMFERVVPGQGELPLREILAAVPPDVIVGIEVPLRSQAEAGIGPEARLRPCVEAARALLG